MFQGLRPLQRECRFDRWLGNWFLHATSHGPKKLKKKKKFTGLPCGFSGNHPANAGDMGSVPGLRRWHRAWSHGLVGRSYRSRALELESRSF